MHQSPRAHFFVAACLLLLQSGRLFPLDRGITAALVAVVGLLLCSSLFRSRPLWAVLAWVAFFAAALLPDCRGTALLGIVGAAMMTSVPPYARAVALLASFLFVAQAGLLPPALSNSGDAIFAAVGASLAWGVSGLWLAGLGGVSVALERARSRPSVWRPLAVLLVVAAVCGIAVEVILRAAWTTSTVFAVVAGVQIALLVAWAWLLPAVSDSPTAVVPPGWRSTLVRWGAVVGVLTAMAPWPAKPIRSIAFFNQGGLDWDLPADGKYGMFEGGMFGLLPIELERSGFRVAAIEPGTEIGSSLREHDVLFVINCSYAWTDTDLAAIADWVRLGGRLIVLGDHTDVFGLAESSNRLMARWGIAFKFDSAYHARSAWPGCVAMLAPSLVWTAPEFLLSHSIGASLRLSGSARAVVDGRWGFSDIGVRENVMGSYLGNYHWDQGERFGDVTLIARVSEGAGSVTVYGDTSAFQNGALAGSYHNHVIPLLLWLQSQPGSWREAIANLWLAVILVLAWWWRRPVQLLVGCALVRPTRWSFMRCEHSRQRRLLRTQTVAS